MLRLEKINGKNVWDILSLKVADHQKGFVADNGASLIEACTALMENGHAFPFGIYDGDIPVGFLMVGFDAEDSWDNAPRVAKGNYSLWRLMIDRRYQRRGYGKEAVRLAMDFINTFPCGVAEKCWLSYEPENEAARRLYRSFGFKETGEYDEDEVIAVLQLDCAQAGRCPSGFTDELISDLSDPAFRAAFWQHFTELGISVRDWEGLFREINEEDGNEAWVRTSRGGEAVGFILFTSIPFTSWFFEETCGFIREFWIADAYRGHGHGSSLLSLAEDRLKALGAYTVLLTTDTAERFYLRHGFLKAPGMKAKNEDPVYIKRLNREC